MTFKKLVNKKKTNKIGHKTFNIIIILLLSIKLLSFFDWIFLLRKSQIFSIFWKFPSKFPSKLSLLFVALGNVIFTDIHCILIDNIFKLNDQVTFTLITLFFHTAFLFKFTSSINFLVFRFPTFQSQIIVQQQRHLASTMRAATEEFCN